MITNKEIAEWEQSGIPAEATQRVLVELKTLRQRVINAGWEADLRREEIEVNRIVNGYGNGYT